MSRSTTRADGKIDVQGWVTLTNSSGTTYDNAQTLLVAGLARASRCRRRGQQNWHSPPAASHVAGGRHGKRQPRAVGRLLSVSAGGTHHDRQPADQAGELPRCARRAGRAWLRIPQSLARDRRRRRRAPRPSTAFPPVRMRASAISCRRECCDSTCATSAATRSSSARAASTTRRWDRPCPSPPAMPST